jgi:hypothetical protein
MKTVIRLVLDFCRTTVAVITRANAVYAGMNLNPAYPTPPVPMAELRVAIDDCSAATTAALDGGTKAIAEKKVKTEVLEGMLRKLSHYVLAHCNDDLNTFLSSGFDGKAGRRAYPKPAISESIRKIVPGPASGQLLVSMVKAPRALSYELRWAPAGSGGSPGDWTSQPVGNTRPFAVTGLTPGTTYAFQGRAVTRSGVTSWSESVSRICT